VPTVLIVDDDASTTEPLTYLLEQAGLNVTVAASGSEGLTTFQADRFDIVLLDLQLPGMAGIEVCAALRRVSTVPIIIVTATDSEIDKVVALEVGADDYVTKPFSGRELIARISAVLRRSSSDHQDMTPAVFSAGPVRIDVDRHRVHINDVEVTFRLKEFALLEFLVRTRGRVLTRGQLIERIWGDRFTGDPKRVDVIVKRLREKIEPEPAEPRHLLTVRGMGYRFDP
jgi:two-component system response regulator RegX3